MANILQRLGLVEPVVNPETDTQDVPIQSTEGWDPPDDSMSYQQICTPPDYQKSVLDRAYMGIDEDAEGDTPTIFKVEEIIKSLPSTLPKEELQRSIISILKSFRIDPQMIREDGNRRLSALSTMEQSESSNIRLTIDTHHAEIEDCKEKISELESKIQTYNVMLEDLHRITNVETERIQDLLGVLGGDEE